MFASATYLDRRKQLQYQFSKGILLFHGNHESPRNYHDNAYPFRQDSSFLYYFGLDKPNLCGVIDVDTGKHFLFGDDFTLDDIVWMGPQQKLAELGAQVGVDKVLPWNVLEEYLNTAHIQGRIIHYLPPYRSLHILHLQSWLKKTTEQIQAGVSEALIKAIVDQRIHKSEAEVEEIEKAVSISKDMHVCMMKMSQPGNHEQEINAAVTQISLTAGGYPAYTNIISINGQTLHNHHYVNTLKEGDLLLGDFGSESALHYAGDITRTTPVGGKYSSRQRDIYQIVLDAEVQAIQLCKPGIAYRDVHLQAAEILTQGLQDLGLMKGDIKDSVQAGAHALFFPHGLGHMMGLDVHDMEDLGENYVGYNESVRRSPQFGLKALRLGRELEPGFVLTVEPGIYFIPDLIAQWAADRKHSEFLNYHRIEEYLNFGGIRIEDNILITDDGQKILGPPIPKEIGEVEDMVLSGK